MSADGDRRRAATPEGAAALPAIGRTRLARKLIAGERWARRNLLWSRAYRAVSYARSALWIVPLVAIVLVLVLVPTLRALDGWLQWRLTSLHLEGARALLETVITLTLSFMVFTFGSLLVAIQVAGGQLTPRIIATTLLRDNVVRFSVGLFVFALVFCVMALDRLQEPVPEIVTSVAALLGIASMAVFLFLIDYAARLLRPVSVLARVAADGLAVIQAVYGEPASEHAAAGDDLPATLPPAARSVAHVGEAGIVLAIDVDSLIEEAARVDGVVELLPQVGDFVTHEEPLFTLYGQAAAIDDRRLRDRIALGAERTLEQDPLFAFRIIVDIALKALSPAIYDPTTAVLAIDQIHRLLRAVGRRRLGGEQLRDAEGRLRLIRRTPGWSDFVHVSCNEIRACGVGNVQICRRLRAMLDGLVASLPAHRHGALLDERERLDRAIAAAYPIADDRQLAAVPDTQGLGGAPRPATTPR